MSTMQDLSYFLPGNKNGVLLIHGLTGTPNEMRILANGLHKAGFTVYAIQLAGHCGTEADLVADIKIFFDTKFFKIIIINHSFDIVDFIFWH